MISNHVGGVLCVPARRAASAVPPDGSKSLAQGHRRTSRASAPQYAAGHVRREWAVVVMSPANTFYVSSRRRLFVGVHKFSLLPEQHASTRWKNDFAGKWFRHWNSCSAFTLLRAGNLDAGAFPCPIRKLS